MAHYAFLNANNKVVQVIVGKNENENGIDWEQYYSEKKGLKCKRTSYNTINGVHELGGQPFRKNFASVGFTYDEQKDAFIPPKPKQYSSWVLNNDTCNWEAPIPYPEDGNFYIWNEQTKSWDLITE